MLAGVSRVDITPRGSLDLSGVPSRKSAGVLDPLEAQVLVLREPQTPSTLAIAAVDTLYVPHDWGDPLRRNIGRLIGAGVECVTLAASHTHEAPGLQTLRQWGTADPGYRKLVAERLLEAARTAADNLQPATLKIGVGELHDASTNRRTPAGPIDPAVTVLRIEDAESRPMVAMVNFACHPVTLWGYKNLISPDFPGYVRRELTCALGKGVVPMYVNGAAGNINPVDFDHFNTSEDYSRPVASRIAAAALEAWHGAEPLVPCPMRGCRVQHKLALDPVPSDEELDAIIRREEQFVREHPEEVKKEDRPLRTIGWAKDAQAARAAGTVPTEDTLELAALRLGDLVLIAVPGELYVEIGLRIKELSPYKHTVIVGYANGALGYLCTRAWQQRAAAQEKFISLRLCSLSDATEDTVYKAASELLSELR